MALRWPKQKRDEAVAMALEIGPTEAGRALGIPGATVRSFLRRYATQRNATQRRRGPAERQEVRRGREKKRVVLLTEYAGTGSLRLACEKAGVHRSTHWSWIKADATYAADFADAREQAAERLEEEARRRAHDGVERPVYQGGHMVGTIREFSDLLLIFLLKGAKPETYRERHHLEHTGRAGGPIEGEVTHRRVLDITQRIIADPSASELVNRLLGGPAVEPGGVRVPGIGVPASPPSD